MLRHPGQTLYWSIVSLNNVQTFLKARQDALTIPYVIYLPQYCWRQDLPWQCSLLSRIDQTVHYISAPLLNDHCSVAMIRPCVIIMCPTTQWSLLSRIDQTVHYISAPVLLTAWLAMAMFTFQSHWSDRMLCICPRIASRQQDLSWQCSLLSRIDQTVCYVSAPVLLADSKTCHCNVNFALLNIVRYIPAPVLLAWSLLSRTEVGMELWVGNDITRLFSFLYN